MNSIHFDAFTNIAQEPTVYRPIHETSFYKTPLQNYFSQPSFHEPSRKIKDPADQFFAFHQEATNDRNNYTNVPFFHQKDENTNFSSSCSGPNFGILEHNQKTLNQGLLGQSNGYFHFKRNDSSKSEAFDPRDPLKTYSLQDDRKERKLEFWETEEGQELLDLAVAGIDGQFFKEDSLKQTKDAYTLNKQKSISKMEFDDPNVMKKVKVEASPLQSECKTIPQQNTPQYDEHLLKKALQCQSNPSETMNSILSTDESDISEISFGQRERSNSNVHLDSICSTPSKKTRTRGTGPKGIKPHIPGLMFNRIKASWKELLSNDDRNFVEDEVKRLKYLSELLLSSGITTKEQRKEFMAFVNNIKSAQTWNNIEKSLENANMFSKIILLSIIAFLSSQGQVDFQDWIQNGRMGVENQNIIIQHKEWFREKFGILLKNLCLKT